KWLPVRLAACRKPRERLEFRRHAVRMFLDRIRPCSAVLDDDGTEQLSRLVVGWAKPLERDRRGPSMFEHVGERLLHDSGIDERSATQSVGDDRADVRAPAGIEEGSGRRG